MTFQPEPNQSLTINGIPYRFAEHPAAPGIPYGQEGRAGVVYQLLSQKGNQALKIFRPRFRTPAMVYQAEAIAAYADLPGLQVCRRTVLTPQKHLELLQKHPDLTYAVLMPWVEGNTWGEIIRMKESVTIQQSLEVGRALAFLLSELEQRNLAHCDLSGVNLILTLADQPLMMALVDVEGIYAPGLSRPEALPVGSLGYAHRGAPQGMWSPQADRFAGMLLLAEMLSWNDAAIRQAAWGESYFDPNELQQEGARSKLMLETLERQWGAGLAGLFTRAWSSELLSDCPTFGEWLVALPDKVEKTVPQQPKNDSADLTQAMRLMMSAERAHSAGDEKKAVQLYRQALVIAPEELKVEVAARMDEVTKQHPAAQFDGWRCPKCGRSVAVEFKTCPYCELGNRSQAGEPPGEKECPACGKVYPAQFKECPRCEGKGMPAVSRKRRIPLWGWLAGSGVILIIVLGVVFFLMGQRGQGPLAFLATETPTMTPTFTPTLTPTLSPTLTATLTTTNTLAPNFTSTKAIKATPIKTNTPISPKCNTIGQTWASPVDGMTLVCVTAGEFLMGSDNSDALAVDNEKPQHRVYLDAFWIDRTEVTNGMYKRCVSDRKCSAPPSSVYGLRGAYYGNSIYENYPVVNVSWNDANAYCGWAGRKLPSEAQWEKAARGPDGRLYPWGNTFPTGSLLNYNFNEGFLMPVGSYLGGESPYGALDMAGNVFEWVGDYYSSGTYSSSPASNPTGPTSGTNRVLRGGSWNFNSKYVRAAFRHWYNPLSAGYDVGFRCASMP